MDTPLARFALTILSWYSLVQFGQSIKHRGAAKNATDPEQLDVSSAFPLPALRFCRACYSYRPGRAGPCEINSSKGRAARARQNLAFAPQGYYRRAIPQ